MTLCLSPLLIFGWGPFPRFGVAGAGLAMIVYYLIATAALIAYLRSPHTPIRLVRTRIRWPLMKDILGVGSLSAVGTVVANLTVVLATGFVGGFGGAAIAGYGMASRLDYLLIPLLFALGTASLTMVGTNVGAGQMRRARHIAWIAALISAGATGLIGLAAARRPLVGFASSAIHPKGGASAWIIFIALRRSMLAMASAWRFISRAKEKAACSGRSLPAAW